jgi:S-adenosylmethionine decarboxylase
MFASFEVDVVIVDYVVRGFTRDVSGHRVYMDHTVRSIRDFIDAKIVTQYHCEDLVLQNENIWQTKMMRKALDAAEYFPPGTELDSPVTTQALDDVRREMAGIFYGWPS